MTRIINRMNGYAKEKDQNNKKSSRYIDGYDEWEKGRNKQRRGGVGV